MEKEQILSTINQRLEADGIKTANFQRTFNDYIDVNLPQEGSEPDDAYFEKHVKVLKSIYGQFCHDVAVQVDEAKKKHTTEPSKNEPGDESNKAILERLQALENAAKESAKNASQTAIRNSVSAKASELKVANKAIWEDAVGQVKIGENDSEEEVLSNAKKIYERLLKRYIGEGASPYGNSGRGGTKESEKEQSERRENLKKKMQSRGRLPKETKN